MLMHLVMGGLTIFLITRIVVSTNYLAGLKHGLRLAHMIETQQQIDHPSVNEATKRAVIEYGLWQFWRVLAFLSMIGSGYLWYEFSSGQEVSQTTIVLFSLVTSFVLAKGAFVDFATEWIEEWVSNLIRIYDSNSMDFIRARMVQIADAFHKNDIGEKELTPLEVDQLNHELYLMLKQVSVIRQRNADLVK